VPRAPVTGTRKRPPWYDLTFVIISWPLICVLVYTEQQIDVIYQLTYLLFVTTTSQPVCVVILTDSSLVSDLCFSQVFKDSLKFAAMHCLWLKHCMAQCNTLVAVPFSITLISLYSLFPVHNVNNESLSLDSLSTKSGKRKRNKIIILQ
jgi:hypothetical protein